jgi:hypothetical protein
MITSYMADYGIPIPGTSVVLDNNNYQQQQNIYNHALHPAVFSTDGKYTITTTWLDSRHLLIQCEGMPARMS